MAEEISGETWGERLILHVAGRIRDIRRADGQSVRELADRTAELNHPVSRQTLVNLEAGRRASLSIDDLLVIAHALRVNPLYLLFDPKLMGKEFEIVPGLNVSTWEAFKWVAMRPSVVSNMYGDDFDAARYVVAMRFRLDELRQEIWALGNEISYIRRMKRLSPAAAGELTDEEVASRIEELRRLIDEKRGRERELVATLEREGVQMNESWWDPRILTNYISSTWEAESTGDG